MSFHMRGIAVAILAALACLVAGASASALTVSPAGSYEWFSENAQWRQLSNGQALTCAETSLIAEIDGAGVGEVPVGGFTTVTCTNRILGNRTHTQTVDWPLQMVQSASPALVQFQLTIPSSGLAVATAGCSFWLEGSVVFSKGFAALPLAISDVSITSSALRISRNNGGTFCSAFPVGLVVSLTGAFDFDRTMTVS